MRKNVTAPGIEPQLPSLKFNALPPGLLSTGKLGKKPQSRFGMKKAYNQELSTPPPPPPSAPTIFGNPKFI